jgi:NinG protein
MAFNIKIDPADRAFSQWIRLRDKKCLRCGRPVELNGSGMPVNLQASHFQGRGKESTRFDPDNVIALCGGCHAYFTAYPAEHYLWQVERFGQAKVDEIILRSNMYTKKDRKMELIKWRLALKELQ